MTFEKDILISYAHIDDEAMIEGEKGWVTQFHRSLEIRLAQLMGRKPNIWRDPKLQGNDYFGDEIVDQFPNVALLVSVLSPRYVKSEWCIKEVDTFVKAANANAGIQLNNKSRIFKVVKTPVELEQHPPTMQGLLGYDFFSIDPETGRAKEYGKLFGPESERAYWAKLDDLAHDITAIIRLLEELPEDTQPMNGHQGVVLKEEPQDGRTVYLAETSYDLKEFREDIKREMMEHGYRVLPDRQLPLIAPEFKEETVAMIDQSELFIHLVGSHYGIVPEGTDKSKGVIQNELAASKSAEKDLFKRLIWIPPHFTTEDARQQVFIELLRNNTSVQQGAELLETPLDELKDIIHNRLKEISEKKEVHEASAPEEGDDQALNLYLICDQSDLDSIASLEDFFFEQGFDVVIPVFEGDESQVRVDHQENLKICDAVVIYYGNGSELWMRAKVRELMKIAGYGRKNPLQHKGVYLALPLSPQKERFRAHGVEVIRANNDFPTKSISDFIKKLK